MIHTYYAQGFLNLYEPCKFFFSPLHYLLEHKHTVETARKICYLIDKAMLCKDCVKVNNIKNLYLTRGPMGLYRSPVFNS